MMPMSGSIVTNYGQEKIKGLTSKGIEIRGSVKLFKCARLFIAMRNVVKEPLKPNK